MEIIKNIYKSLDRDFSMWIGDQLVKGTMPESNKNSVNGNFPEYSKMYEQYLKEKNN